MEAQEGDIVEVPAPSGVERIEVLEHRYGGARGETRICLAESGHRLEAQS
jgi:hypothetical protein